MTLLRSGKQATLGDGETQSTDSCEMDDQNFVQYLKSINNLVGAIQSSNGATHASASAVAITQYWGDRPNESAQQWITNFERASKQLNWTDSVKLSAAPTYFARGSTACSWQAVKGDGCSDWTDWSKKFLASFNEIGNVDDLALQMRSRLQRPGEKFTTYLFNKLELCQKCGILADSDEALRFVKAGMRNRNHAGISEPLKTIDELIEKVRLLEDSDRAHYKNEMSWNVNQPESVSFFGVANGVEGNLHHGSTSATAGSEGANSTAYPPSTNPFTNYNYNLVSDSSCKVPQQPIPSKEDDKWKTLLPINSTQDVRQFAGTSIPVPQVTKNQIATDIVLQSLVKQMERMESKLNDLQVQRVGGAINQPPQPRSNGYRRFYVRDQSSIICNYCGKSGHMKRECYALRNRNQQQSTQAQQNVGFRQQGNESTDPQQRQGQM